MEDRSSMSEIVLYVGKDVGECRLTPLAQAMRNARTNNISALVEWVCALELPTAEFTCMVGVKVELGWGVPVDRKFLPAALKQQFEAEAFPQRSLTVSGQVSVKLIAYELLVEWRTDDLEQGQHAVSIPISWHETLLSGPMATTHFRNKIRWLMTELMLARYRLDSYREHR